jgi:hypothetical protein
MDDQNITRAHLQSALNGLADTIITEMVIRSGEVNQRLDRIDATLVEHGKQLAAGARALAGVNERVGKADADSTRTEAARGTVGENRGF